MTVPGMMHYVIGVGATMVIEWDAPEDVSFEDLTGRPYEVGVTEALLTAQGAINLTKRPMTNEEWLAHQPNPVTLEDIQAAYHNPHFGLGE